MKCAYDTNANYRGYTPYLSEKLGHEEQLRGMLVIILTSFVDSGFLRYNHTYASRQEI